MQKSVGEYLENFDLLGFVETWCEVKDAPVIKGFKLLGGSSAVKNSSVKGRKSGGVLVYGKESLQIEQVAGLDAGPNSIFVRAGDSVFVFVYRHPDGSLYVDREFFC